MKREIFEVHIAYVNDAGFHVSDPNVNNTAYPVVVDSKNYDGDIEKARRIAYGKLGAAESWLSTRDNQISYAYIIRVSDGVQIEKRMFGKLADVEVPDPDPEPETPEETEPEAEPVEGGEG